MRTINILAIASLASLVLYQSGNAQTSDPMTKAKDEKKTYTGCVEAGATAGSFTLTHVTAENAMQKDAMSKDAMRHDSMSKDAMSKDAMGHDAMSPSTLSIAAKSIDLSKYVGKKVSVSGIDAETAASKGDGMSKPLPGLWVASLKTISATCGK